MLGWDFKSTFLKQFARLRVRQGKICLREFVWVLSDERQQVGVRCIQK